MSQDEMSKDAFDEQLTRLFAERNEPLADHEFMHQVVSRLERQHRLQWIRRGFTAFAIMLLAAVVAPWVVQGTLNLFSLVGQINQVPGINIVIPVGMVLIAGGLFLRTRLRII